jgi:hypothetical protein
MTARCSFVPYLAVFVQFNDNVISARSRALRDARTHQATTYDPGSDFPWAPQICMSFTMAPEGRLSCGCPFCNVKRESRKPATYKRMELIEFLISAAIAITFALRRAKLVNLASSRVQ